MPSVVFAAVMATPLATEMPSGSEMPEVRVEIRAPTTPVGAAASSVAARERSVFAKRVGASLTLTTAVVAALVSDSAVPPWSV